MSDDDALLATIEIRIRGVVAGFVAGIVRRYSSWLTVAITAQPQASGAELTSTPALARVLTDAAGDAHERIASVIRAGYRAAARAGLQSAAADLSGLHPDVTDIPTASLDAILGDIRTAIDQATLDITASVAAAHDRTAGATIRDRAAATRDAATLAARRLGVRVRAAVTVAIHRGYTDAQQAAWQHTLAARPDLGLAKKWQTTSISPCPACAALDGTTIPIDATFDPAATTDPHRPAPNTWRDLTGPPRHPNCRCRTHLILSNTTAALRDTITTPTNQPTYLSADAIRAMDEHHYQALVAVLTTALNRLRKLMKDLGDE